MNHDTPTRRRAERAPSSRPPRGAAVLAAALGLAAATAARAQAVSPYYIGASQGFTRETNLVRAPEGQPAVADTVSTTSLLAGFDRFIGRQRVYLNGSVRHNAYRQNESYDNTGYGLATGIDWSTANRISGVASLSANRSLAQFGQVTGLFTTARNIASTAQFDAAARIGTVTPLTFEGTYTHQRVGYSADQFKFAEYSQNTVGLGLLWRSSALLTTGTGVRFTRGHYPQGSFGPDDYTGRNLDFNLNWTPSGASTVSGRLSYNRTQHDDRSQREFSGFTGNLVWRWQPSGKWRLNTQLTRATGEDATFIRLFGGTTTLTGTGNYSTVTDALALNAQYLATGKITLDGTLTQTHRTLRQSSTLGGATASSVDGSDNTRIVSVGVRYAATRTVLFSCNVGRDVRTASTTLSYPYRASYFGCNGQLTLQP